MHFAVVLVRSKLCVKLSSVYVVEKENAQDAKGELIASERIKPP